MRNGSKDFPLQSDCLMKYYEGSIHINYRCQQWNWESNCRMLRGARHEFDFDFPAGRKSGRDILFDRRQVSHKSFFSGIRPYHTPGQQGCIRLVQGAKPSGQYPGEQRRDRI